MKEINNKLNKIFLPFADRIFSHDPILRKYVQQMKENAEKEENNEIL